MLSTKEGAACTAPNDIRQNKSYRSRLTESSLKLEIGELLFCLQFPVGRELRHIGWRLLEQLICRRAEHIGVRAIE